MARIIKEKDKGIFSLETEIIEESDRIQALSNDIRIDILEKLNQEPTYPSKIAEELDMTEQRIHYHIKEMESRNIIEKVSEEYRGGSLAKFYRPVSESFTYEIPGSKERPVKTKFSKEDRNLKRFFNPLLRNGKLQTKIAVGSPDPHGPHQVRGRDGHLAIDLACKLGNLGYSEEMRVVLDTEIKISENDSNLLLVGGPLTNMLTEKINDKLPVKFGMEKFPYRSLKSKKTGKTYSEGSIGVINKTTHPLNNEKKIYVIAGIRNRGTRAAVMALTVKHEELFEDYDGEDHWGRIVRGLDMDGDGDIDEVEIIE